MAGYYLVLQEGNDGDFRLSPMYYTQAHGLSQRCLARHQWHHIINRYIFLRALLGPVPTFVHIDTDSLRTAWTTANLRQPLPQSFIFQPISTTSCCRKGRAYDPLYIRENKPHPPVVHWFLTTVLPFSLRHLHQPPRLLRRTMKRKRRRHLVVRRRMTHFDRPKRRSDRRIGGG